MFDIIQAASTRGLWPAILVGGCCKTTPDDIKKLKRRIDTLT
jgi:homocysteine S-methyltransferase